MKYYLAYGSNLNLWQMKYRCPDAKIVGTAKIPNYQLLFKGSKTGSYLTIEKKKGSVVPVAVFAVSQSDEDALDRYEGFPSFYYKEQMTIKVKGKAVDAFVYIMHEERKLGIPSKMYMQICFEGYRFFGFDSNYLKQAYKISKEELK